jgi:hypothetical protein
MGEITFRSGQVTTADKVRGFFEYLLSAEESGDPFPVDLDIVWPMAYTAKSTAKKALVDSNEFFEDVDYLLKQNLEQIPRSPKTGGAGLNKEKIFLSVSCLEYFIARKVRPIFDIYRQCRIEITKTAKSKARLPYHLRRYLANHDQVPFGYFSVLQEITTKLIAPMEMSGYTLADRHVPDISVGRVWCNWLRGERNINPDEFPTYDHAYEDGRIVKAKLYPVELLSDFVALFQNDWIGTRAEKYFRERDEAALPHIPKKLEPPNKATQGIA